MRRITTIYTVGVFIAVVHLLPGCATTGEQQIAPAPLHDDRAQALMKAGNFIGAAEEYLRLGQQLGNAQSYPYRVYAAEAYLEAKQPDRAESILVNTTIPERDTRYVNWQKLLQGRIALAHSDFPAAKAALVPINTKSLPITLQTQVLRNRAYTYDKLGEDIKALADYVSLDAALADPKAQNKLRAITWQSARKSANKGATSATSADNTQIAGWLALAQIAQLQQQDRAAFDNGLRDWQQRYPGHPAQTMLPDISAAPLKPESGKHADNDRIALLLPLTGQFANAGAAIRDGIIAAWYEDKDPTQTTKPKISVYDVSAKNVVAEYKRAVTEGATAVIGPLEKPAVSALITGNVVNLPTIVLNQTDATNNDPNGKPALSEIYEFSLSPEDEAEQVAERTWFDGHARAYVLSPSTPWGERVRTSFKRSFERLGGTIVGSREYRSVDADANKDSADEGQGVAERPANALGTEDNPAAVGADFVFLGAFPTQGHQLARTLAANSGIPIYSTSHIYSGKANVEERDLEGVVFCDMPWVLDAQHQAGRLAVTVRQTWPKAAETYGRLFALGIDAYHLLPYLNQLRSQPTARFEGETGTLSVDGNGHVHRRLAWAQYSSGHPVTLESSSTPQ